jgi:hypothetical protein
MLASVNESTNPPQREQKKSTKAVAAMVSWVQLTKIFSFEEAHYFADAPMGPRNAPVLLILCTQMFKLACSCDEWGG